jgi:3',5'-cyclic AMP phosphodiesterase CpdA
MGDNVRWLHLSDFHVGMDDYGQRKLFYEICEHVRVSVESGHSPDLVFITGDIANKGIASEYLEFVDAFLYPLLAGC